MPRISVVLPGPGPDRGGGRRTLLRRIALASETGADGLEIPADSLESTDSAYLRRLRQEAAARGLKISMVGPLGPGEGVAGARRFLQATAEMGGRLLRILADQPGSLHELLPYAESTSVAMVLEPPPSGLEEDYLAVLEAVKSPWLKAQWAPGGKEGPAGLIERLLSRLAVVRVPGGGPPILEVLERALPRLAEGRFDGWFSVSGGEESSVEQVLERLHGEVQTLRAVLARHFPLTKRPGTT